MNENNWVQLLPSGEWEVEPDLRGYHLKALQLDNWKNKIFTGKQWLALPQHIDALNGLHISDMRLYFPDRIQS